MSRAESDLPTCDYCGLPLGTSGAEPENVADAVRGKETARTKQYCCFGCQFAASVVEEGGEAGQARWAMARLGIAIFFAMNVMMFTMALWSQDWPDATASDRSASALLLNDLLRHLSLLFSLPVLILLGEPIVTSSLASLSAGRWTTDVLLLLGVAASFVYSAVAVWTGAGHVYFEVGCAVLVAVTLGRWLEATGKLKTTAALEALTKLLPEQVRRETNSGEQYVPLRDIQTGDSLRVLAGERIPTDGVLRRGCASIDEQVVTGESRPKVKELGDVVYGGTLNLDGDLSLEVTAGPDEGTLQRLVAAVRSAALAKGEYQQLADHLAAWFLPAVVIVAALTFSIHSLRGDSLGGLLAALAVVVIACPCALGVATPLAVWAALGRAARGQVLFRGGDALSRLAEVRVLAFDKTGTLTTGDHRVRQVRCDESTTLEELAERTLPFAASSIHTHCRALREWCERSSSSSAHRAPGEWQMIPGRGLRGRATPDDPVVYVGSPRFLTESGLACDGELQMHLGDCLARGEPLVCVGWEGRVRGLFVLTEELRAGVEELLSWAKSAGYRVVVLTGDYSERGAALQRALDVEVLTELLPDDKLDVVRRLRDESGPVAMIGDGANDAPALAGADVGIALGCGADVSRQTADVCLLASDLSRLPWVLGLSRQAVATIRQNLFWAFAYNAVGIVFAATGWLHPALAAAAMVASSGFVVANSLRLAAGDAGPIASDNSVAKKIPAHVSEHRAALSQAEATADA